MVCQSMEWLDSGELRGFYNCRLKIEEFGFWGGDVIWSCAGTLAVGFFN